MANAPCPRFSLTNGMLCSFIIPEKLTEMICFLFIAKFSLSSGHAVFLVQSLIKF